MENRRVLKMTRLHDHRPSIIFNMDPNNSEAANDER